MVGWWYTKGMSSSNEPGRNMWDDALELRAAVVNDAADVANTVANMLKTVGELAELLWADPLGRMAVRTVDLAPAETEA